MLTAHAFSLNDLDHIRVISGLHLAYYASIRFSNADPISTLIPDLLSVLLRYNFIYAYILFHAHNKLYNNSISYLLQL